MSTNLLTHSRKHWRNLGYYVEGTESIVRLPGGVTRRSDLFGFADLVAVPLDGVEPKGGGIPIAKGQGEVEIRAPWVFLQVTSHSNGAARVRKIREETTGKGQWERPMMDLAEEILERGDRIVVEGWHQPDGPGTRWVRRPREVTIENGQLEADLE